MEYVSYIPKTINDLIRCYEVISVHNPKSIKLNSPDYEDYLSSPDEGIEFIENLKSHLKELQVKPITKKMNIEDIKATCHVILVSMSKNFSSDPIIQKRQLREYIKNRKSTVYSSLGKPIGELVFDNKFFLGVQEKFKVLPKLKKLLFFFCYQHQNFPEFSTACILLVNNEMTTIKSMFEFINLPKKTEALKQSYLKRYRNSCL